jgi:pilin isopeptide linkage protein
MKKVIVFSVILMLMTAVLCVPVNAAQSASVNIWVSIKNGGTAAIITEVNSPLPDRPSITLDDGKSEAFHIEFSEEGSYSYTIRIEPDERDIRFDDTVYRVGVYVREENGKLYSNIVIYNEKSGKKYSPHSEGDFEPCTVTFVNDPGPDVPDTTETTTVPEESGSVPDTTSKTEQPPGITDRDQGGSSRPQTGDDSTLDFYLLLAILASAGLFMLSVFYYRSVVREVRKR